MSECVGIFYMLSKGGAGQSVQQLVNNFENRLKILNGELPNFNNPSKRKTIQAHFNYIDSLQDQIAPQIANTPQLTMENGGSKQNVNKELIIKNQNAVILSFITNSKSVDDGTEIGITKFEGQKSNYSIKYYYVPEYKNVFYSSSPVISSQIKFEYGPREIKLTKDPQIIEIPSGTYLTFSDSDQSCKGRAFSGLNTIDFLGYTKIVAISFISNGYIELWSSSDDKCKEIHYVAFKNSSISSCDEVITIIGQVSYKSKFSPFTNCCVYAGISKGKISISDTDKSAKFYKSDGTPYQYRKDDATIPLQLVISTKAYDDKIKFKVKDKESNKEIVIRNGRQNYMSYSISEDSIVNDDNFDFDGISISKIIAIIIGFTVFIVVLGTVFIVVFICTFTYCCKRKSENSDTTTSSVTQTHVPLSLFVFL